jgi:ABC-type amino acid transport system permease subunit
MMNNDMTEQTNIERIVMQRVHLIRALKIAISTGVLSLFVSLLALWGIGREVWVANVLQNAPKSPLDTLRFYVEAFTHTRLIVQILFVLLVGALLYIAREITRALAFVSTQERY